MATRKLIVEIVGDASSLSRTFRGASDDSARLGGSLGRLSIGLGQLAKGFIAIEVFQKAFQGLDDAVHLGIEGFSDTTKVAAQTAAVIKSTGDASNLSAKQIHALAASLSNVSGIDDEVIQSGENVLASFTQIRDFAGKNNDIFTRATDVLTDYVSRTGKSATTAATIIGRALADPATKAVALSRAGIVLTKSQLEALKAIEKTSGVVAAQKVLLGDLETRYQGAAAAAGKTLPGQLNILRERFKDLAGELVGDVTPSLKGAAAELTAFVVKLTEAKGGHAKLDIVVDGLQNLGSQIGSQFEKIDFRGIASRLSTRVGDALGAVNWKLEIEKAGKAAGDALAATFNALSSVLDRVDWNKVGQVIVDGLGKAVGAVLLFLHSVDWKQVGDSTLKLLVAGFKAQQSVFEGIGEAIGKALLKGLGDGLDSLGAALEKKAIKIVLGIIDPFTHLPKDLGGGPFQDLKNQLDNQLDGMVSDSQKAAGQIQAAFASIPGLTGPAGKPGGGSSKPAGLQGPAKSVASAPSLKLPPAPPAPAAAGLTATQKNTFFDNAISSDLTRAGFITNIKAQISALQNIAGLVSARIAATKDVTRRRTLEDQLLGVESQITGDKAQVAQDFLASLQFGITKAQATATFKDDIPAFTALENGIKAQIKATGDTQDLQQQLFDAVQGLKAAKSSQLSAKDFKILGFTATGDDITPGLKRLRTEFANTASAISGTSLDTSKVKTQLAEIKKVISDSLVPQDVRAKMQALLANLQDQLKKSAGPLTKTTALNVNKILSAAGLDTTQEKVLRARLSHFNSAGNALAGTGSGSSAPRSAKQTIVVQSPDIIVDGRKLTDTVSKRQHKTSARNPGQRRGPNAGLVIT